MTVSFHHAFRNGDYVTSMVVKVLVEEMGLKDLTVATTSLGSAQDLLADYIEEGKIIGIQSSGVRGRIGEVISAGKLKTPAIIRSHGGRPRAIETGELAIDITFIAASSADDSEMQTVQAERITAARSVMPSQTRAMQIVLSS